MIGGEVFANKTLTHSAITFLMDFLWYILFLYLVGKTGTHFIYVLIFDFITFHIFSFTRKVRLSLKALKVDELNRINIRDLIVVCRVDITKIKQGLSDDKEIIDLILQQGGLRLIQNRLCCGLFHSVGRWI